MERSANGHANGSGEVGKFRVLREVHNRYDDIIRLARSGELSRAARDRITSRESDHDNHTGGERPAEAVAEPMGRLRPLDPSTFIENKKLRRLKCLRRSENSILTDEQKSQVLGFFDELRDIKGVTLYTGIPQHFVKHYLNQHSREQNLERAVKMLSDGTNASSVAKALWCSPSALSRWMKQSGHGDLLKLKRGAKGW
ncbi:MAG: hypothetical protein KGH94_03970 [Candidatus Micrarchaeota archaeon]|nr:hypothetical protein [Candidatus Micrarchaeota archaeon]